MSGHPAGLLAKPVPRVLSEVRQSSTPDAGEEHAYDRNLIGLRIHERPTRSTKIVK